MHLEDKTGQSYKLCPKGHKVNIKSWNPRGHPKGGLGYICKECGRKIVYSLDELKEPPEDYFETNNSH